MAKEIYNYQKALHQDIVIRKISEKKSLPVGISLKSAMVFVFAVAVIYITCHGLLNGINQFSGTIGKFAYILAYGGAPYGILKIVNGLTPDGLNIVQYIGSLIQYGGRYVLNKTNTYHDRYLPRDKFSKDKLADDWIIVDRKGMTIE